MFVVDTVVLCAACFTIACDTRFPVEYTDSGASPAHDLYIQFRVSIQGKVSSKDREKLVQARCTSPEIHQADQNSVSVVLTSCPLVLITPTFWSFLNCKIIRRGALQTPVASEHIART